MYREFFNIHSFPFNNNPDPRFLCMMPETKEALACLEYGVSARKGVIVMMGEVGTGKTTLLRSALNTMRKNAIRTSFIFNPRLETLEFLELIISDFGLVPGAHTKSALLVQLNTFLIDRYAAGETCVLVIDEAQSLSLDLLEEIRLLTNLETDSEKLLQIVLSGQPELELKLKDHALRQLRQRISLWCRTYPLTAAQTVEYVTQRLVTAGAKETIFLPHALRAIYVFSSGIPRVINLLCEHAMILSFVESRKLIPEGVIEAVATDLGLGLSHEGLPAANFKEPVHDNWPTQHLTSQEKVS